MFRKFLWFVLAFSFVALGLVAPSTNGRILATLPAGSQIFITPSDFEFEIHGCGTLSFAG